MWQNKKKERDGELEGKPSERLQTLRDRAAELEREKLKLEKRLGKVTT